MLAIVHQIVHQCCAQLESDQMRHLEMLNTESLEVDSPTRDAIIMSIVPETSQQLSNGHIGLARCFRSTLLTSSSCGQPRITKERTNMKFCVMLWCWYMIDHEFCARRERAFGLSAALPWTACLQRLLDWPNT
mmetsp:Transcript_6102/g.8450  ORF Transcript_6102/g.8450 Transcript_6102/m.8450 type:complete len:133 (+) Transcript_6102:56-454(+)